MKTTFIYVLIDPTTLMLRYVGKADNPVVRLQYGHLSDYELKRKSYKNNWIKSLKSKGLEPQLEVIDEVLESEWQFWEKHYISLYKSWGFDLTNGTNGGEGFSAGYKHSEATRLKISIARRERKQPSPSAKTRQKMSIARKGKKHSAISIEKMKLKQQKKGKSICQKIAKTLKGTRHTEERILKNKLSHIGHKVNEDTRKKISMTMKKNKMINRVIDLLKKECIIDEDKGVLTIDFLSKLTFIGFPRFIIASVEDQMINCNLKTTLLKDNARATAVWACEEKCWVRVCKEDIIRK